MFITFPCVIPVKYEISPSEYNAEGIANEIVPPVMPKNTLSFPIVDPNVMSEDRLIFFTEEQNSKAPSPIEVDNGRLISFADIHPKNDMLPTVVTLVKLNIVIPVQLLKHPFPIVTNSGKTTNVNFEQDENEYAPVFLILSELSITETKWVYPENL